MGTLLCFNTGNMKQVAGSVEGDRHDVSGTGGNKRRKGASGFQRWWQFRSHPAMVTRVLILASDHSSE